MRRPYLVISAAWLLFGISWFLPAVTGVMGGTIDPFFGWEAFLFALSSLQPSNWPDSWVTAALTFVSIVTVLLFLASPWIVRRRSRSLHHKCAWFCVGAFAVNAHWYLLARTDGWISNLGIGYFLWWWSFALLAIGLFDLAEQRNDLKLSPKTHLLV